MQFAHTYEGQMAMAASMLADPSSWGMTSRLAHREAMAIRNAAEERRHRAQLVNVFRCRVYAAVEAGDVAEAYRAAYWCCRYATR